MHATTTTASAVTPASMPQLPSEFNSPRDYSGHGSHTASTAGGNANVPPPARPRLRFRQRHRSAGPHRCLQGVLVVPGTAARAHGRHARRHRPGRRRRRGRHQLLHQRHAYELPRPGRDRVPVRRRRRHLRGGVGRQQRPGHVAPSPTPARGSPRLPRARTTATATARSRWATAPPSAAPPWPRAWCRTAHRRRRRRPARRDATRSRSATRRRQRWQPVLDPARSPARSWSATVVSTLV